MKELQKYERPNLEVIEFLVEAGFGDSLVVDKENAGGSNGPDENETWGW